jgi:hypothetical protein
MKTVADHFAETLAAAGVRGLRPETPADVGPGLKGILAHRGAVLARSESPGVDPGRRPKWPRASPSTWSRL